MREHLKESDIPLFVCSVWGRFSACGMNRVLSNHFIFPSRCLCTARENDFHESLAILPEVFPFRYPVWHSFFSLLSWDDIQIFRRFGMNHVDWKSSSFFTTLLSGRSYSHFSSRRNKRAVRNGGEKPNAVLLYVLLKLL